MATSSIGKVVKLDKNSGAKLAKVMASESQRVRGGGSIGVGRFYKDTRSAK